MQILSFVLTSPSLLLSTHTSLTHTVFDVFVCPVTLPILSFSPRFPPLLHSSFFSPSSCLWKTPRQSYLGSRGTQTPMASGLWLSLLCQVCQVCVCAVTGKLTPCWLRPQRAPESAWYPKRVPLYHFLSTL